MIKQKSAQTVSKQPCLTSCKTSAILVAASCNNMQDQAEQLQSARLDWHCAQYKLYQNPKQLARRHCKARCPRHRQHGLQQLSTGCQQRARAAAGPLLAQLSRAFLSAPGEASPRHLLPAEHLHPAQLGSTLPWKVCLSALSSFASSSLSEGRAMGAS